MQRQLSTQHVLSSRVTAITVVLKIDFANAFNSIHRDKVLAASEHLPSLFTYVHSSYGALSFFAFGDHLLLSDEREDLSSPLNLWHLNDWILGGSRSQVLADFELISQREST